MAPKTAIVAIAALCSSVFALPSTVEKRENKWSLECGNQPGHIAGNPLGGSVGQTLLNPYPVSGSNQASCKYLYCVPGTNTYVFFGLMDLNPPPTTFFDVGIAFSETRESFSQQADVHITGGSIDVNPANSNIQLHMQNAGKNGQLTWGIVGSALTGLATWAGKYNTCAGGNAPCAPMVFQINDGEWGEVGIGYAGFYNATDDSCIIQIEGGNKPKTTYCKDFGKFVN